MAHDSTPSEVIDGLRSMVLNLKPEDIGITKENFPHPVFAIVMETGFQKGSCTLSSIADGTTSLYFSSGGGIIGGGTHENVRTASGYFLSGAQHFFNKAQKVTAFPKPDPGRVTFYFVSFEGVFSYTALEDDLGNKRNELSDLFFAAHNVIAELRKMEDEKQNES